MNFLPEKGVYKLEDAHRENMQKVASESEC